MKGADVEFEAKIEPLSGALPALAWKWDPETDILSGGFEEPAGKGMNGSIELTDDGGAVAVLDVQSGAICGLDIVVWPEVTTGPLKTPKTTDGRVVIPAQGGAKGVSAIEVTAPLTMQANDAETLFHLQIGEKRSAQAVRVADHLVIEVDEAGGLAGLWLSGVPPFPALDE